MLSRAVLPWFVAVLLGGCGKSPEASKPNPISTTERAQGEKSNAPPTDSSSSVEAALNAVLGELTQALRKYSFERQRLPTTLNEVVAAGYVQQMPPAPPGKKFAIDAKTVRVVLVNQ